MRTYKCDLCNARIEYEHQIVCVEFPNGDHPHGSTLYKKADLCGRCAAKMDGLKCSKEWSDVVTHAEGGG